jgi:protocatechuate 3,4-dioxygenase beta subunit
VKQLQHWFFFLGAALAWPSGLQAQDLQDAAANAGPALTITGTVFDASGTPASDVPVSLVPGFGSNIETRNQDGGKFSFTWRMPEPRAGAVPFIYARDLVRNLAASHDIDETTTRLDLRLQPALTLSVKVRDVNGKPIPTATETLLVVAGHRSVNIAPTRFAANDQGVIEIKVLPQERWYIATITAKGYGTAEFEVQASQTRTTRFDFPVAVLRKTDLKLAGTVLGPDSKPVPGAWVHISGNGQPTTNVTTDANGHFAFDAVCEGEIALLASDQKPGARMSGAASPQGGDTNVVIRFGVEAQGLGANAPLMTISGRVLDPSGAPISGAVLSVVGAGNVEVKSDADGKYSITLQRAWLEENHTPATGIAPFIYARGIAQNLAGSHSIDATTTNLDLHLQPGLTLAVKVQDEKGKPIPTATEIIYFDPQGTIPVMSEVIPVKADDRGVIEIKALAQGRYYKAYITAKGYGSAVLHAETADTRTTRFDLPPAVLRLANRKLAGQVLGPDDQPVAGAPVTMGGEAQLVAVSTTDAQGRFAFDSVCEGPVTVTSWHPNSAGFGMLHGAVEARGGQTNIVIKITPVQPQPLLVIPQAPVAPQPPPPVQPPFGIATPPPAPQTSHPQPSLSVSSTFAVEKRAPSLLNPKGIESSSPGLADSERPTLGFNIEVDQP